MLKLIDLIGLAHVPLGKYKIHCATGYQPPPLIAYFDGKFKQWQEYQNRRNFECDSVISLIHLHGDKWLFVGVWKILGAKQQSNGEKSWVDYQTSELPGLDHLSGRTIISFKRGFRASYLVGPTHCNNLLVSELLEQPMSVGEFPGYSSTLLSHDKLRLIISRSLTSWRSALKSVSGVYLIVDTSCGKQYVGSAYGNEGIWGRWSLYAASPHGGNSELLSLLNLRGEGHCKHFQFSILEICDIMATKEEVFSRERHWKNALKSREFGYNSN